MKCSVKIPRNDDDVHRCVCIYLFMGKRVRIRRQAAVIDKVVYDMMIAKMEKKKQRKKKYFSSFSFSSHTQQQAIKLFLFFFALLENIKK